MRRTKTIGLLLLLNFSLIVPFHRQAIGQINAEALAFPNYRKDKEFLRLEQTLVSYGFQLIFQPPPRRNTYGLFDVGKKSIWINPVVFALGNAHATLVHEAVHAAQFCAYGKPLHPLGISISKNPQLRPFFLRYQGVRRQLEAEAYTIQADPQKVSRAIALLNQHCQ